MNKTININLGGQAFTIDDDAFDLLQRYIKSLKSYFKTYEECDDILYDIESRLSEIIKERMDLRNIVSVSDVREAINQMGRPEDFETEEEESSFRKHRASRNEQRSHGKSYRTGKRLMRDPDNKRIAGVCSGLSLYFGIGKPILVRILFVLLFLVGLSPLVYVILWALMPMPKTAADRLAMKGEDINYDSIAKEVQDEFHDLKERLSNLGR